MKSTLLPVLFGLIFSQAAAQLSGTISVPATYSTLAAAIAALNAQGTSGALTVQVAAGYTETSTSGGYSLYASGSASAPIVFVKSGSGANPILYAYSSGNRTPGSAIQDGIWRFVGCDYVTVDGIDLKDLNSTNPATMEFGYGFFKAAANNGCQHNTIRNCRISLSRNNNASGTAPAADGSRGIELVNALPASHNAPLVISSQQGSNSFNSIHSNTIVACNTGIAIHGFADTSPYTFADQGNDVGGNSAVGGNLISGFGGGGSGPVAGIRTQQQYDLNINNNVIRNYDGSGPAHAGTLRGIYIQNAVNASTAIRNNTLTLRSGATGSQFTAIENSSGTSGLTNTLSVTGNLISGCRYPTSVNGSFCGIWNTAAPAFLEITSNVFSDNATNAVSGSTYLIYNSGQVSGSCRILDNRLSFRFTGTLPYTGSLYGVYNTGGQLTSSLSVSGNSFTAFYYTAATGSGAFYLIHNTADVTAFDLNDNYCAGLSLIHSGPEYFMLNSASTQSSLSVCGNTLNGITRNAAAANCYGYYSAGGSPSTCVQTFSGNVFTGVTASVQGTGSFYGIYTSDGGSASFPQKIIHHNRLQDIRMNASGNCYGIYVSRFGNKAGTQASSVHSNTIADLQFGDDNHGVYVAGPMDAASPLEIRSNDISGVRTEFAAADAYGIYIGGTGMHIDVFRNRVALVSAGGTVGLACGIGSNATGTLGITNNLVGRITAPAATGASRVSGVSINGASGTNVAFNTIFIDGSSSGQHFSSNGLFASSSATLQLKNNIIMNVSAPTGSGVAAALRRSTSTLGNYLTASGNNIFYAGNPSAANVIYHNGSGYQTMAAFQTHVAPREAASASQSVQLLSQSPLSPDYLHLVANIATAAESGATPVPGISADYDLDPRQGSAGYTGAGTSPDIGADEFELDTLPCTTASAGTLSPVTAVCEGQSVFIVSRGYSRGAGVTHQWKWSSAATGPFTPLGGSPGITELITGTLSAGVHYYQLQTGCSANSQTAVSVPVAVTVHAIPSVTATVSNSVACAGQSLGLSGSSDIGSSFRWTGPDGFESGLQSPSLTDIEITQGGIYHFYASHMGCVSPASTLQLVVDEVEISLVVLGSRLCGGQSATLQALQPAFSYSWSNGAAGSQIIVSPGLSTVYSVSASSSLNCKASESVMVSVSQATISGQGVISCDASKISTLTVQHFPSSAVAWYATATSTLALGAGPAYTLSPPPGITTVYAEASSASDDSLAISVSSTMAVQGLMFDVQALNALDITAIQTRLAAAGTASVEVWQRTGSYAGFSSSANGWSLTGTSTVTCLTPGVPVHLSLTPVALGAGDSRAFYVVSVGGPSLSSAVPAKQGSLSASNGDLRIVSGMAGNAYFNQNLSGMITEGPVCYRLKGCSSARLPLTLTVSTTPSVTISGGGGTICPGTSLTLTATGAAGYTWSTSGTKSITVVSPSLASVYSLTAQNIYGCPASATVGVAVFSLAPLAISGTASMVCPFSKTTFTASGAQTYTWSTGSTGAVLTVSPAGSSAYTVTGTDLNGCRSISALAVATKTVPYIQAKASTATVCPGGVVTLTASGAATYTWFPGAFTGPTYTAQPFVSSAFNVAGTSVNGCTAIAMGLVQVEVCESAAEFLFPGYKIFPNPVSQDLTVSFNVAATHTLQLSDLSGRMLVNLTTVQSTSEIEMSHLPDGVYILSVKSAAGLSRTKIILNKQ